MADDANPRRRPKRGNEVTYEYTRGFRGRVDPNIVGPVVDELERTCGICTAEDYVEKARNPASPLHASLTWDDTVAANLYRLEEARSIIRAVVRVVPPPGQPTLIPRVNIKLPDGRRGYMNSARAMEESSLRDQIVAEAESMLRAVINRYRGIPGLWAHLREALDRLEIG